jgi:hypothetical protein
MANVPHLIVNGIRQAEPRLTLDNRPAPPTFTPNDRYVTAGDCTALGHVYVFSTAQQNWRCASCSHVAPAGRPAPTLPVGPSPHDIQPLKTQPVPGWTPDTVTPMLPSWPQRLPFTLTNEFVSDCAFDNLPPEDRGKPMGLVCRCRKCSPIC